MVRVYRGLHVCARVHMCVYARVCESQSSALALGHPVLSTLLFLKGSFTGTWGFEARLVQQAPRSHVRLPPSARTVSMYHLT